MVNVNVPLFVGVPVMRPLDLMSLSPLGSLLTQPSV